LLSLFTAIGLVVLFVEEIEKSILELELLQERDFISDKITENQLNHWESARMDIYYLPDSMSDSVLPDYMRDRSAPFRQELIIDGTTYLLRVDTMTPLSGRVYLSQNITILESRLVIIQVTLFGIALAVCFLVLILARRQAVKLSQPLNRLISDIQSCEQEGSLATLQGKYEFKEFELIAASFNRYVERQRESINREKSFIKLASHELRTPLSVIAGATDVMLKRGQMGTSDSLTIDRIRQATTTMQDDVNALLQLTRQQVELTSSHHRNLIDLLAEVSLELERSHSNFKNRIELLFDDSHKNGAPPQSNSYQVPDAMGRLVFRNLTRNALQHTDGKVVIEVKPDLSVYIRDFGQGLPIDITDTMLGEAIRLPVEEVSNEKTSLKESSFGLLIVQLVCERLNWTLELEQSTPHGTTIKVTVL